MLNLSTVFDSGANEHPGKTAIVFGETRLSYAAVRGAINKIANGLASAGIGRGDHVALSCPNLPYFPMVYYAILKAGATVVPLNVLLKAREIGFHLKDGDAKAYFCFQGTAELPMAQEGHRGFQDTPTCEHFWVITADPAGPAPIEGAATLGQLMAGQSPDFDVIPTEPNDTAVILYTSGTTGFPKGAELSHSNMVMNAIISRELFGLTRDDVHVVALPLFHSFGQTCQMNAGFSMGNTEVLIPRFSPEAVLSALQAESGTVFAGVPTMYWQLLTYEDTEGTFDLEKIAGTLRLGVSGGASMPVEILRGVEEKYRIPILEGYGLSETSPVATFNQLHKPRKVGSIGTPVWGVELMVVGPDDEPLPPGAVGELVIRGHNVMKGYYNQPDATEAAFHGSSWFHTGDLGRADEDGYLYIVDRVKDMIIRGGFNVYPREIEEILLTHPAISLAAVIGVPHPQHGEEVKAYVVLNPGNERLTADEIVAWSRAQMASFKYPRVVEIRDSLPMTATGKILKKELKAELS